MKKRAGRMLTGTLALLLALALPLFLGVTGTVGQAVDMAVVPAKVEFVVQPGASQSQRVKVYNQGSEPLRVLAYLEDYFIDPENRFEFFPPGHMDYSVADWVSFSESDFIIPPGPSSYKEVTITMQVPPDAPVGGYASAAVFEGHHPHEEEARGLVTVGRIGVPLLTSVATSPGEIKQEGTILSLQVGKGTWVLFTTDLQAEATFKNTGNTYLHYHAFTDITGGITGREYHHDHGESTALALSDRKITYTAEKAVFGRYRVRVEVHYPPDRVLVQEKTVWVIPWLLIVLAAGFLLLVSLAVYLWRRRKSRRKRPSGERRSLESSKAKRAQGDG